MDSINVTEWMATNDPEKFELYDIIADPYQENDISAQNSGIVEIMKQEMVPLWREMRDEGLAGKNNF